MNGITEGLRSWIFGVVAAAFLCSAALTLTPEGRIKRITRLVCSLVGMIALIRPLVGAELPDLASLMSEYRAETELLAGGLDDVNIRLEKQLIEQSCEEYISDRSAELGVELKADVTAVLDDNGYYYPYSAELTLISGGADGISRSIEAELGIPRERQYWSGYDAQQQ